LLPGHTKIENAARYLGTEAGNALGIIRLGKNPSAPSAAAEKRYGR
jgi:hypothetical protein